MEGDETRKKKKKE